MATYEETALGRGSTVRTKERTEAQVVPAVMWGLLGAFVLAFIVFIWAKWISGPYFQRVGPGPTPVPSWMRIELGAQEVFNTASIFVLIGWFLVRPIIRERRVTTDGLLSIVYFTFWFEDPLSGYFGHWFTYNSWLFNRGSWVNEIPGWMSVGHPGAMTPEPMLWTPGVYVWSSFLVAFLGCWVMRKTKERRPHYNWLQLLVACFIFMILLDLVLEVVIWMPLGAYQYPGASKFTLFGGTYHQFPIWEAPLFGAFLTGVAALRYFRNDKGETFAERGIHKLSISGGKKTVLRFLALLAAGHTMFFLIYNVPVSIIGAHETAWPKDITSRSYMTDGICGDHTKYACPNPTIPVETNKTFYISPSGTLLAPKGAKVSAPVKFRN